MKNLLPLFASALFLAGCASDDSINPWSTEQERADAKVAQAETTKVDPATGKPAAKTSGETKYSWQKKAAEEAKKAPAEPAPLPAGKAVVTAIRGDAGLIQIKLAAAPAVGDKLVLSKDGKSLLIVVHSVDADSAIADIAPLQVNTPTIAPGEEVACAPYEAPAAK